MRKTVLILLFVVSVFAENSSKKYINITTKSMDNIVDVDLKVRHLMIGEEEAKRKKRLPSYMTHLNVSVANNIVYDIWTNSDLKNIPKFKFKFSNENLDNEITIFYINNDNKIKYKTFLMKEKSFKSKTIDKKIFNSLEKWRDSKPQAWKAKNLKNALTELYSSSSFEQGGFKLNIPKFPPYYAIKLNIKSKMKFKSIAVLKNTKQLALVAVFNLTQFSIIDYDLILRSSSSERSSNLVITVVGQTEDGKLYGTNIVRNVCTTDCDEY